MVTVDASVWVAAADPADRFCADSRAFFGAVVRDTLPIHVPALARVEIACALGRRLGDGRRGRMLAAAMLDGPLVQEVPMDLSLVAKAVDVGTERLLRGPDAFYAATAEKTRTTLVAWDGELIQRGGAVSPATWLASRA